MAVEYLYWAVVGVLVEQPVNASVAVSSELQSRVLLRVFMFDCTLLVLIKTRVTSSINTLCQILVLCAAARRGS
jgi:hypothetical protein